MKNIASTILVTLLLVACGSDKVQSVEDLVASGDLEQIRAKKAELDTQQQELTSQLKQLEGKIKELDPQAKIPLITTFAAKESVFDHYLELQGNVNTKQNLVVYPEFSGQLVSVYVKEGQRVKRDRS